MRFPLNDLSRRLSLAFGLRPLSPWVVGMAMACAHVGVLAQEQAPAADVPGDVPANLRPSFKLEESLSPAQRSEAPTFLMGDRLSGRPDLETVVEGHAELRKPGTVIKANRLEYSAPDDRATATGDVRINRGGNVFEGPSLDLQIETFEGFFIEPQYQFLQNGGHGEASRADFLGPSKTVVYDATYTTCRRTPGPSWMPDWVLKAARIDFDSGEEVGVAHGGYLRFKDVDILPVPPISFPLTEKRKSGLLPATFGVSNVNGTQVSVPYYWNIAPNYDATITPTIMTARGVDTGVDARYLEPGYKGEVKLNYMTADKLRNGDRWGVSVNQEGKIGTDAGDIGYTMNLNRVSDDNYWSDFSANSALTARSLPADINANWGDDALSVTARWLKWQTLQIASSVQVPAYDQTQLHTVYSRLNDNGFDWSLTGDASQFVADSSLTGQPNAQRLYGLAQISRPFVSSSAFFTPKLQLHSTGYQFDAPLANGSQTASATVPTLSIDTGLVFERNTNLLGRGMVQTLEPRLFYVNTPYRNQSMLPNYDTAAQDFNFASIFTENAYSGNDKISDNNLMTFGLSSRFLDAASGEQLASFGIAQRYRFEDQLVTLTPSTAPERAGLSDVMLGTTLNLSSRWAFDSTVQYNPITAQSTTSSISGRYSPGPYRVLNMGYRFQRNVSEYMDVSWQWPLNDLWTSHSQDVASGNGLGPGRYYGVGRMNYSLMENKMVNTLMGLEYDAGCWLARVVVGRVQTSTSSFTDSVNFEIEFVGLTRLGVSPLETLKSNISRYQNLRDVSGTSSRFSNYD